MRTNLYMNFGCFFGCLCFEWNKSCLELWKKYNYFSAGQRAHSKWAIRIVSMSSKSSEFFLQFQRNATVHRLYMCMCALCFPRAFGSAATDCGLCMAVCSRLYK